MSVTFTSAHDVQSQFVVGWKEIATYMRKSVRTVQRYERKLALPVRRPSGTPEGSVVAAKEELDAWVAGAPFREAQALVIGSARDTRARNARDMRAGLNEMERQVEKLRRLRDESAELGATLHESVVLLQKNLHFSLESAEGLGSSKKV